MKKKRIIFITLGVIIVLTIGHFALSKPVYTLGAKIYLANKYSWNIKDIETVKYQRDYFDSDFGFMFLDSSNSISYSHKKWIFRYKKRDFNVERYHLHYADDYQLEDIFNWCTEYLQENYDKDIIGVEVYSDIIYHSPEYKYDYKLPWNYRKVFNKNDAEDLIELITHLNKMVVFYFVNDLNYYGKKYKNTYIPNGYYFKLKQTKQNSFNFKTAIVLTSIKEFDYSKYSVLLINGNQTKYSLSENEFNYIVR